MLIVILDLVQSVETLNIILFRIILLYCICINYKLNEEAIVLK